MAKPPIPEKRFIRLVEHLLNKKLQTCKNEEEVNATLEQGNQCIDSYYKLKKAMTKLY